MKCLERAFSYHPVVTRLLRAGREEDVGGCHPVAPRAPCEPSESAATLWPHAPSPSRSESERTPCTRESLKVLRRSPWRSAELLHVLLWPHAPSASRTDSERTPCTRESLKVLLRAASPPALQAAASIAPNICLAQLNLLPCRRTRGVTLPRHKPL